MYNNFFMSRFCTIFSKTFYSIFYFKAKVIIKALGKNPYKCSALRKVENKYLFYFTNSLYQKK